MGDAPQIEVVDDPAASRYVLRQNGEPVGLVTYRRQPGVISLLHTEVDPARERRGLGSRLVREVLDDARAQGLTVHPICPFVAAFIERHSEYADLVVS